MYWMIRRVGSRISTRSNHEIKPSEESIRVAPKSLQTSAAVTANTHLTRMPALLIFSCTYVSKAGFFDQLLKQPPILDCFFNVPHQLLGHVNGKALVSSIARQCIAAMAYARFTGGAVVPNAGTLSQRY